MIAADCLIKVPNCVRNIVVVQNTSPQQNPIPLYTKVIPLAETIFNGYSIWCLIRDVMNIMYFTLHMTLYNQSQTNSNETFPFLCGFSKKSKISVSKSRRLSHRMHFCHAQDAPKEASCERNNQTSIYRMFTENNNGKATHKNAKTHFV